MKIPEWHRVLHIAYEKEEIIPTTEVRAFSTAVMVTHEMFDFIMKNPDRLAFEFPYEVHALIKDYRKVVMAVLIHEDNEYWLLHKERRKDEVHKHKGIFSKCLKQ